MNPWGYVIGIRPAKILYDYLQRGLSADEAVRKFCDTYRASEEKACMVTEIAKHQMSILSGYNQNDICLYIGIPFCKSRCLYCSFVTSTAERTEHLTQQYIEALQQEMQYTAALLAKTNYNIVSLYIGGGTPTALSCEQLASVIDNCYKYFDLSSMIEFTVEAGRPDTIDEEKLLIMKDKKVTRISINPQTMNDRTLNFIGRHHTAQQIVDCYNLAVKCGFDDINMDLIAGLPSETLDDFKNTINLTEQLSPASTTVHTLSVKRGSRLHETLDVYTMPSEQTVCDMIDYAYKTLTAAGKTPYYLYRQKNMVGNFENIGYARDGFECLYNIMIMEEITSIFSVGCGGVTKIVGLPEKKIERIFNVKEVYDYIKRIDEMCKRKDIVLNWLKN